MTKKKILHIICNDKFTSGYINFMLKKMTDYSHFFIVMNGKYDLDLMDSNYYSTVKQIDHMKEILNCSYKKKMIDSDKIIVSGIFGFEKYLPFLSNKILSKTYLQFWGGDFYYYRDTKIFTKKHIHKLFLYYCIKRCRGIINLISNDYNELTKIFPNEAKHYVGTMPLDPRKSCVYGEVLEEDKKSINIIIGNSATKENNHLEVFKKLEHLKNENIKIVSPLSYGDMNYAKEVINIGKEIFGDKFEPITEYMEYEKYIDFLSTFQVGIFNNNRQQAMGNINALLRRGKKVYIRYGTSMWKDYNDYNIRIFDINELKKKSIEDLVKIDIETQKKNIEMMKKRDKDYNGYNYWKKILDL